MPPVASTIIGGICGFIGGKLFCDDICCRLIPEAEECGGTGRWPKPRDPNDPIPVAEPVIEPVV